MGLNRRAGLGILSDLARGNILGFISSSQPPVISITVTTVPQSFCRGTMAKQAMFSR